MAWSEANLQRARNLMGHLQGAREGYDKASQIRSRGAQDFMTGMSMLQKPFAEEKQRDWETKQSQLEREYVPTEDQQQYQEDFEKFKVMLERGDMTPQQWKQFLSDLRKQEIQSGKEGYTQEEENLYEYVMTVLDLDAKRSPVGRKYLEDGEWKEGLTDENIEDISSVVMQAVKNDPKFKGTEEQVIFDMLKSYFGDAGVDMPRIEDMTEAPLINELNKIRNEVVNDSNVSWTSKGSEIKRRMIEAGFTEAQIQEWLDYIKGAEDAAESVRSPIMTWGGLKFN